MDFGVDSGPSEEGTHFFSTVYLFVDFVGQILRFSHICLFHGAHK